MRRALAREFSRVPGVAVETTLDDRLPAEAGPWSSWSVGDGRERAIVTERAARADFTLCVAPETDGILAERLGWIAAAGGRSLSTLDESLVRIAGDKGLMADWWRARGIRTPPVCRIEPGSALPDDYDSGEWPPYPAVLKPIDGAGCLETRFVRSSRSARRRRPSSALSTTTMALQPYIPGEPMSAAYLRGPGTGGTARPIGLSSQSIVRRGGWLRYDGGTSFVGARSPEAERGAAALPGALGWIGIDLIRDPRTGVDTLLELNPRVTTSIVGYQAALGTGWIGAQWLAIALGEPPTEWPDVLPPRSFDGAGVVREETMR